MSGEYRHPESVSILPLRQMYGDRDETEMVKRTFRFWFFSHRFSSFRVLSDQEREEKYGARRKRFRENRATEEDPDIYKYLAKEEKLLVEDIAHALYQSRAYVATSMTFFFFSSKGNESIFSSPKVRLSTVRFSSELIP